eukprot:scaffold89977_cov64-Phaeocystis_antarctica.AAC.3
MGSHAVQSVGLGPLHAVQVVSHGWHTPDLSSNSPEGHASRQPPPCSSGSGSAHEVQIAVAAAEHDAHWAAQLCLLQTQSPASQSEGVS